MEELSLSMNAAIMACGLAPGSLYGAGNQAKVLEIRSAWVDSAHVRQHL